MYAIVLIYGTLAVHAFASSAILFENKIPPISTDTKFTEISIAMSGKNAQKLIVKGHDVGIRALFEKFSDQVVWDNKAKFVAIKNNGKELVIPFSENFKPNSNQITLPDGWAYFKDGRTYLRFPYFAYLFDRYAEFKSGSEEDLWKQKLSFLNIDYIDTNDSTPKDQTIHSSLLIKS
ncbi:hypothetical protein GZH47_03025 [Paenibacillus rhizovicinus]|uniref:Copper amine oxidase-like N-terminal domain-containing protein n=1 Tax=Paenibacillus rhizovicinus TaxID=2704463 RepID=A0A6C0NVF4_9BACL|nr:stalk domain-containing protein [Paenibacillus rhizovicinus]QHW29906.1 hypothetical protein GZH47_03025 [Paenibacillus rhizovicinus]